jgi:signal transduction histidine kinase/CheY-like chemotaxis protein
MALTPRNIVHSTSESTLLATLPQMPHLGSWELNTQVNKLAFSVESLRLLGIVSATETLPLEQFYSLLQPQDADLVQKHFQESLTGAKPFQIDLQVILADHTYQYLLMQGTPVHQGNQDCLIKGILLNINERKRMEFDLVQAKETAEAISQSKSEFLSSMSHEIRTPMNAIIGLTDMLLQEELKPQILENLRMIKYSSDNLLVLINDILDISKIEANKVTFEQTEFDLYRQMHDLSHAMGFKAREKELRLNCDVQEGLPQIMIGDPYRLNQILFNLISNAIKFTHQGQVNIRVTLTELRNNSSENDRINLSFSIEDSGIGIAEDELNNIFERFVQASSTTTRQYGGTGLGLAITKRLVELQDGTINASSTIGKGTTFTIELPFKVSNKTSLAAPKTISTQDKDLSGVRLLMVEDNSLNQIVAKRLLNRWKADIEIANDGKEALQLLSLQAYDVVLMDIHLPVMNGYEITKLIRNGSAGALNAKIPIIALTADAYPETKEKTRQSGMDDWVIKPFEQDLFYEAIVRNLPQVDKQEILEKEQ